MNRRAALAALAALALRPPAVHAQDDLPPLAPRPNPSDSCAEPFIRRRVEADHEQFIRDVLLWVYENDHVRTGYIALAPEVAYLMPKDEALTVDRTKFLIRVMDADVMPPGELYVIVADCGWLL